jgi:SAM-dependent methyltransferase
LLPEFCETQNKAGMGYHQKQRQDAEFCKAYLKSMDAIATKQLGTIESRCKTFFKGNLLDIGAGPSTLGRYLVENKFCRVTAIDFPEIVDAAEKLFPMPDGFFWQGIDFMDYYPEQPFDIAYCGHLLEYLSQEDMDRHLTHIKDVLVSNGKVVFVCFLREEDANCLQIELDMFELSTCLNGASVGQVVSGSQMKKLLRNSGYDDIQINALSKGPSYNEYVITCSVSN